MSYDFIREFFKRIRRGKIHIFFNRLHETIENFLQARIFQSGGTASNARKDALCEHGLPIASLRALEAVPPD